MTSSSPEPTVPLGPIPYGQPTPYAQPTPFGQPTPYGQAPYGPPSPYAVPGALVPYGYGLTPHQVEYQAALYAARKSRVAAGLLALLIGTLGIHNFYLGRTGIGLTQLLLSVLSLGFLAPLVAIWSIIEGILILTRSPSFAADRRGIPLRD